MMILFCLFLFSLRFKNLHGLNPIKAIGIDFGTSGVRCIGICSNANVQHEHSIKWSETMFKGQSLSESWISGLHHILSTIPSDKRSSIERICLSGTSASVLVYDTESNKVSRPTKMYNYNVYNNAASDIVKKQVKECIEKYVPPSSSANSPTSTLPKVLEWHYENRLKPTERIVHQADYIIHELTQAKDSKGVEVFTSDWHNTLKLGYDVKNDVYPSWFLSMMDDLGYTDPLDTVVPKVREPGKVVGSICNTLLAKYGFHKDCQVVAGTTDSIAAFIAAGPTQPGQAVTSLGSTIAIKLLSTVCIEDASRGIYSHRLGNMWLVGGASNSGCAILKQQGFTDNDLIRLSHMIDPYLSSGLNYYPLSGIGERFPINDPYKLPLLDPKPDLSNYTGERCQDTEWRRVYLHGILEGMSKIEKQGYDAFNELGATPVTEILTCGGGAKNEMWTKMREHHIKVPTRKADNVEASYGCALLALRSL